MERFDFPSFDQVCASVAQKFFSWRKKERIRKSRILRVRTVKQSVKNDSYDSLSSECSIFPGFGDF